MCKETVPSSPDEIMGESGLRANMPHGQFSAFRHAPCRALVSISARSGFAFACQLFGFADEPLARGRTRDSQEVDCSANRFRRSLRLYLYPSEWMLATLEYNEAVGYLITAADGKASVNLTDPEWRAPISV